MPKGYLGIQNDLQIADDLHLAYVSFQQHLLDSKAQSTLAIFDETIRKLIVAF